MKEIKKEVVKKTKEVEKVEQPKTDFYIDITDEEIKYVVKAYDNTKRKEEDQMVVTLASLSARDLDKLVQRTANEIAQELAKESDVEKIISTDVWTKKYRECSPKWEFILKIKELKNFKFKRANGEIIEFTDAEKLYEYKSDQISSIVREIEDYITTIGVLNTKN